MTQAERRAIKRMTKRLDNPDAGLMKAEKPYANQGVQVAEYNVDKWREVVRLSPAEIRRMPEHLQQRRREREQAYQQHNHDLPYPLVEIRQDYREAIEKQQMRKAKALLAYALDYYGPACVSRVFAARQRAVA